MDYKIEDDIEEDELESFDENLNKDPISKGNHKLVFYAAIVIFVPCASFLILQVPHIPARQGLIPFMGFEIDMVVIIIALFSLFMAVKYRDGY